MQQLLIKSILGHTKIIHKSFKFKPSALVRSLRNPKKQNPNDSQWEIRDMPNKKSEKDHVTYTPHIPREKREREKRG